ncbi:MAG: hypothetical protein NPIRA01_01230 [Nitrospirales bacterium]|nr:MAG: hypothetical protein NPIRA01_01230 [Nitrospirales bacterium]
MTDMKNNCLLHAMRACVENGQRLHEDAEWMGSERSTTAVALCILAQEEFAKAFLLHLVYEGTIPWTAKVRESLYNHKYKQLVGIIMEWLSPSDDEFIARLKMGTNDQIVPAPVADAMKLYVEKVLPNGHISCPPAASDSVAMTVVDGDRDKTKQDALYVRLSKEGEVCSIPSPFTHEIVEAELDRTKRLGDMVGPLREGALGPVFDYALFVETMNFLLLDKRNRPFLLLKESKFDGPVAAPNETNELKAITVLIENISYEQATGVNGHAAVFVEEGDKELFEQFFRIEPFMVDPHTTMICTFDVSKEIFNCRTSPSHKLVLYVNFKYHGTLTDRIYHVRMWSRYDSSVGIFRETLTDLQESVNGGSQPLVETKIWWNRPTIR